MGSTISKNPHGVKKEDLFMKNMYNRTLLMVIVGKIETSQVVKPNTQCTSGRNKTYLRSLCILSISFVNLKVSSG